MSSIEKGTRAPRKKKPPKLTDLQVYILLVASPRRHESPAGGHICSSFDIPIETRTQGGEYARCPGVRSSIEAVKYGCSSLGVYGKTRLRALVARGYLTERRGPFSGSSSLHAITEAGIDRLNDEGPRLMLMIEASRAYQRLTNDAVARERAGLDE